MKRFHSRLLSGVLAAVLAVTTVCAGVPAPQVQAEEAQSGYEIYPNPQEVSYDGGSFDITSKVNVVLDDEIDVATKNRLDEILESKSIKKNDAKEDNATTIYVGIYNEDGEAKNHISENYVVAEEIFEHSGAYILIAKENEICVLGKDTDAAFYGLTSLKHIFNQMEDMNIRSFTMKDYADTSIRGFIEGYYGLPWSNEDRISLMKFGGDFKMTSYVFAPKDDPYHSAQWRDLYPEGKLAEIREMAAAGNASKCKFVWTIHPFMHGGITDATYANDLEIITAKFEQLYEAGVRQFGVLGDDAGSLPRTVIIRLMNDLQKWVNEKGDVYDLVFCPGGYNDAWQNDYSELNDYDKGFDPRIKIFWTGQAVCQPIEQKTLTNFRTKNLAEGQATRRAPLFWLNWPVNDINMSRLMMGKGSLLHTDINVDDLAGAVTNPMQDAQASKVAIFAVADYAWNVKNFHADQSWADSFKYVDPDAAEALHTIAKHMSDPSPNNHGLVLEESEELKPLLDDFMASYEAGNYDEAKAQTLIGEFEKIIAACDEFHALSKNTELKKELLPFTDALKDLCEANIYFFETEKSLEAGNAEESWTNYANASAKLASAKNHDRITIDGTRKALPAAKWITPFANKLNTILSAKVGTMVDENIVITSLLTNRPNTPNGALENLTDHNEGTQVIWSNPNSAKTGDYIGLSYNRPIKITDITFKMGQSGNPQDTFQSAKVQYTEDGTTWLDIAGSEYTDRRALVEVKDLDIQAKGIRLIATADMTNMWLGCKDIIVNKAAWSEEPGDTEVTKTIEKTNGWKVYQGDETSLTDGDNSTGVWYWTNDDKTIAGDYLGLDLGKTVKLSKVKFAVGNSGGDKFVKYHLAYSANGTDWTTVKSYTGAAEGQDVHEEDLNGVLARYVRIINDEEKGTWVKFGEFDVELDPSQGTNEYTYTNVEALKELKTVHTLDETHFLPKNGLTLKPGEYIGLKLERIKDLTAVNVTADKKLTVETSENAVVWTDAKELEDARYIRIINKTDANVTFDLENFAVESFELEPISIEDNNTRFYESDGMEAFDKDRTTEVVFYHSQIKGDFITYDLGQVITLNSLALVSKDSAGDFPRHAKISVSEDGTSWKDVMYIGDQDAANKGEAEGTDNIMDVLPIHDVSSNLKKTEGLNDQVRYIKFELTRTKVGPDKWTRFTEIELNGGNMFLPSSNDPTITTEAKQSDGNVKENMLDGDLATTFTPVGNDAGVLTYHISEKTDQIGKVRILQSPSTISGAEVQAEVLRKAGGQPETVTLGTLSQSLNEFNTSAYENVLSVTVAWTEGKAPTIYEIILAPGKTQMADYTAVDAAKAKANAIVRANYTAESLKNLNKAVNAVVDGLAASEQARVNEMAAAIEKAYADLVLNKYKVTVTNGTVTAGGKEDNLYNYNAKLTVKANAPENGQVFAGWEKDGKIVSAQETYTFFVGTDIKLTAVYDTAASEIEGYADLQDVTAAERSDGKSDIRYLAQLTVPQGAKLKEAGLVWSNKGTLFTKTVEGYKMENQLVTGLKITNISKISTTYQFSVTIKGVPTSIDGVPGKIFATYTLNGQETTIYSDVKTGVPVGAPTTK